MRLRGRRTGGAETAPEIEAAGHASTNRFFEARAASWEAIYDDVDVYSVIHQQRLAKAQEFVDHLAPLAPGRALDVGCGAGVMTSALARRGVGVTAVDMVPAMIELTRTRVREDGVSDRVGIARSDVQSLPFAAECFALVTALGVVPWVPSPRMAIAGPLLPQRQAVAVHRRLQRLADRRLPLLRSAGTQYLVMVRKSAPRS